MSLGSIELLQMPPANFFALGQHVWVSHAPKLLSKHTFFNATPAAQGRVPSLATVQQMWTADLYKAMNGRHYETALCKDGVVMKIQHAAAEHAHLAL
jgi:hypothetical protein